MFEVSWSQGVVQFFRKFLRRRSKSLISSAKPEIFLLKVFVMVPINWLSQIKSINKHIWKRVKLTSLLQELSIFFAQIAISVMHTRFYSRRTFFQKHKKTVIWCVFSLRYWTRSATALQFFGMLKWLTEIQQVVFHCNLVEKFQATNSFIDSLTCKFRLKLVYDKHFKQYFIARELQKILSLNIDEITTTVAHCGIFDP